MNKFFKILVVLERFFITKIVYVSDALYMEKFSKYLLKIGVKINGTPKYIFPDVYFDGSDYSLIDIGDNVTISKQVMFLTHDYSVTTAMASIGKKIERGEGEIYILDGIKIGKNCFIGARVSILPGTEIGDNVIVGAGCVVKGKVPCNSIIVGNPWKIIGETSEYAHNNIKNNDLFVQKKR